MYASFMYRLRVAYVFCVFFASTYVTCAESPDYLVFVSNERSGDVTVIDGRVTRLWPRFRLASDRVAFMRRLTASICLLH